MTWRRVVLLTLLLMSAVYVPLSFNISPLMVSVPIERFRWPRASKTEKDKEVLTVTASHIIASEPSAS